VQKASQCLSASLTLWAADPWALHTLGQKPSEANVSATGVVMQDLTTKTCDGHACFGVGQVHFSGQENRISAEQVRLLWGNLVT